MVRHGIGPRELRRREEGRSRFKDSELVRYLDLMIQYCADKFPFEILEFRNHKLVPFWTIYSIFTKCKLNIPIVKHVIAQNVYKNLLEANILMYESNQRLTISFKSIDRFMKSQIKDNIIHVLFGYLLLIEVLSHNSFDIDDILLYTEAILKKESDFSLTIIMIQNLYCKSWIKKIQKESETLQKSKNLTEETKNAFKSEVNNVVYSENYEQEKSKVLEMIDIILSTRQSQLRNRVFIESQYCDQLGLLHSTQAAQNISSILQSFHERINRLERL